MTGVYRYQGLWWAIIEGRVAGRTFYTKAEAIAHIRAHKPGWLPAELEYAAAAA